MASPRAAVAASPTIRLKKTAPIIFQERSASQSTIRTPSSAVRVSRRALCLMTENWSSFIGTGPVVHGSAVFAPEIKIGRRATNSLGRLVPRLQIGKIQGRLYLNKMP